MINQKNIDRYKEFSKEQEEILIAAKQEIQQDFHKLLHKENSQHIKKFEILLTYLKNPTSNPIDNILDKTPIAIAFRKILKIYFEDMLLANHSLFDEKDIKSRKPQYDYDVEFGLRLYDCFLFLGLPQRVLNKDSFWIFLTLAVIPDIVYQRWSTSDAIEGRFFKRKNRIWLKTTWWYIHLTWQGSFEETQKTIEKFTTDCSVQLVERSGNGYDIDLYRAIAKRLKLSSSPTDTLRKVMKLNTARSLNFIYILDMDQYVNTLFSKATPNENINTNIPS